MTCAQTAQTLANCPFCNLRPLKYRAIGRKAKDCGQRECYLKRRRKNRAVRSYSIGFCIVPGCASKQIAKGLCTTHYNRQRLKDPNWNRLKVFRRRRGTVAGAEYSVRPTKFNEESLKRAAAESNKSVYALLNDIIALWARQYEAGGYVAALSPGNIVDPKAFYETKRHLR
jgi:hypothetical protein